MPPTTEASKLVKSLGPARETKKPQKLVLWVDDRPDNNIIERRSMAAYNIDFVLAQSTGQALAELRKQRFDAVISDMGRPPDSRAGYTLLEALRGSGDQTPYFIYAGLKGPRACARSAQPRCSGHHEYGRRAAPNVAAGPECVRPPIGAVGGASHGFAERRVSTNNGGLKTRFSRLARQRAAPALRSFAALRL